MIDIALTYDQAAGLERLRAFHADLEATSVLVEGPAGVGKTVLLAKYLEERHRYPGPILLCAPTWKAVRVLQRKLDEAGVEWTTADGPDARRGGSQPKPGTVITATTQAALGLAPVVVPEQTERLVFGKQNEGLYRKLAPPLLIVDEVSQLAWPGIRELHQQAKRSARKIICIGDAGQLPPVQAEAIPFGSFKHRAELREIVRQAADSNIIRVGHAIRYGEPWGHIVGGGVRRTSSLLEDFLNEVQVPGERPEEQRECLIAYRNVVVNAAQDLACQKLYGHGYRTFAAGELVLSETTLRRDGKLLAHTLEELVIDEIRDADRDAVLGLPVELHRRANPNARFTTHFLPPEDFDDDSHAFNVELLKRLRRARELQAAWTCASSYTRDYVDLRRCEAWRSFFMWREQVISFRHPFALTSHRSQGSTYRQVFADTNDLRRWGRPPLYVACTRPSTKLIIPE